MQIKHPFLLLAVLTTTMAYDLAVRMPQPDLSQRDVITTGGWSLALNTSSNNISALCPADAPICGSNWCCPSSLTCVYTGGSAEAEVCCDSPDNTDQCIQDFGFLYNTTCADSSWVLWNTTTAGYAIGFFCCLPGQVGTQDGYCVSPSALETSSATEAVKIGTISTTATATGKSTKGGSTPTGSASGSSSATATATVTAATGKSEGVGLRIFGTAVFVQILGAGFIIALV